MPLPPELQQLVTVVEKLRMASVQHGAAIKSLINDVGTLGHRLNAIDEKEAALEKERDEAHAAFVQLVEDVKKIAIRAGVSADDGAEGEADVSYSDDEQEAEYEDEGEGVGPS